jgi:hypothetical protein
MERREVLRANWRRERCAADKTMHDHQRGTSKHPRLSDATNITELRGTKKRGAGGAICPSRAFSGDHDQRQSTAQHTGARSLQEVPVPCRNVCRCCRSKRHGGSFALKKGPSGRRTGGGLPQPQLQGRNNRASSMQRRKRRTLRCCWLCLRACVVRWVTDQARVGRRTGTAASGGRDRTGGGKRVQGWTTSTPVRDLPPSFVVLLSSMHRAHGAHGVSHQSKNRQAAVPAQHSGTAEPGTGTRHPLTRQGNGDARPLSPILSSPRPVPRVCVCVCRCVLVCPFVPSIRRATAGG